MLYARTSNSNEPSFVPDPRLVEMVYGSTAQPEPLNTQSESSPISPMLAKAVNFEQIKGKVLVQPKIDGIRAIWNPNTQQLHTRSGNVITSCEHIIKAIHAQQLQHLVLDGEIYTHELPFQVINGLVRRQRPEADNLKLQYHIFDRIDDSLSAIQRAEWLASIAKTDVIKAVATFYATPDTLDDYYQCFLDSGFEGMIIRDPKAKYQQGRSAALGKIKPTLDMEATLIGFEKATTRLHQDSFGALILQLPNGKTFNCSGITDAQRRQLWQLKPIGEPVTFLYEGLTQDGIPRFPRFKTVRHDLKGAAV